MIWLYVIYVEWEIKFQTSALHMVHNFNNLKFCQIFDKYNTKHGSTPKVEPIYWKPNPQSLNTLIIMYQILSDSIWSALIQVKHKSNNIYIKSDLIYIWMGIIYMNLHQYQIYVHSLSPTKMMSSKFSCCLNHSRCLTGPCL